MQFLPKTITPGFHISIRVINQPPPSTRNYLETINSNGTLNFAYGSIITPPQNYVHGMIDENVMMDILSHFSLHSMAPLENHIVQRILVGQPVFIKIPNSTEYGGLFANKLIGLVFQVKNDVLVCVVVKTDGSSVDDCAISKLFKIVQGASVISEDSLFSSGDVNIGNERRKYIYFVLGEFLN